MTPTNGDAAGVSGVAGQLGVVQGTPSVHRPEAGDGLAPAPFDLAGPLRRRGIELLLAAERLAVEHELRREGAG
jgi:hypothetical protein